MSGYFHTTTPQALRALEIKLPNFLGELSLWGQKES